MNKSELIEKIADVSGESRAATARVVDALLETVVKAVGKGDSVALVGFGTFSSTKRAARTGRNPQTGAAVKIPAKIVPKFKAGTGFRKSINGSKKK